MSLFTRQGRTLLLAAVVIIGTQAAQAQQQQYWIGDGRKDIRLAVLEPAGKGLSTDEKWMLSLVQGSIAGDFNKYSAMTIIDRQNLEKIFAEWKESLSGNYSDADRVKIGNLTNANHILTGSISKTANAFMLELTVTDVASGVRKASYSPTPISPLALENLSAINAASADLLKQLGVNLTSAAQAELTRAANTDRIQAETMLARGIAAQRQGTEVAALSYFFQAAAFDSSLFEASKRSSVIAANISSGNVGADVRNDILWRKSWLARLTETEVTFYSVINSVAPPYTLFYTAADIKTGNVNYQTETADLSIPISLRANVSWFNAMSRSLKAADAVLEGLNTTKKKNDWGLSNWPQSGVSNTNPFVSSKRYDIAVVFELVNEQGQAIGSQTVRLNPSFSVACNSNNQFVITFIENYTGTVNFNNVKADDISDRLTVRVASVNGGPPQNARFTISALSSQERLQNTLFRVENGIVLGFDGSLSAEERAKHRELVIPKEAWGNPVTAIGDRAFANGLLISVTIPNSITYVGKEAFANNQIFGTIIIPDGVTAIGDRAFANGLLTSVTIPKSITYIGKEAFANNQISGTIIIPDGVTSIGERAFANNRQTGAIIPSSVTYIGNGAFYSKNPITIKLGNSNTIIDTRDDQRYRTVKVGSKTWMAENLKYNTRNSRCYDNAESNCNKYGRLYTWKTAMEVCPPGWHLSEKSEWDGLVYIIGGKTKINKLKSMDWYGSDDYGFSTLPGGFEFNTRFSGIGQKGYWWTSTAHSSYGDPSCTKEKCAETIEIGQQYVPFHYKDNSGLSVRCVQND